LNPGDFNPGLTVPVGMEDIPFDRVPLKQSKAAAAKGPVTKLIVGALLVLAGVILLIRIAGSFSRRRLQSERRRTRWAY
jgi:hypothetical protein